MEPPEIFALIVKADEKLKYATKDKAGTRAQQARALLEEAFREAEAVDNQPLAEQARTRLADLDTPAPE